jgi:hypothetical protein
VAYKGLNVLENDELRQGIKTYCNWPTIPQLYVHPRNVPVGRAAAPAQRQRPRHEAAGDRLRV